MMKTFVKNFIKCLFIGFILLGATGCYSVFSGGTGGTVVDSESTSTPKNGIANVDVYAYTNEEDRNTDFSKWTEGTIFAPGAEYYGHTTTGSDGSFTLGKLVWKTFKPTFGKDADVEKVYMLYYHENYGLTKGETVIISDSATDTVYQELTKVRKSTVLNLTITDVSSDNATGANVYVKVSVPQTTAANTSAKAKVYSANITGNGSILISYPRYQSDADKANEKETEPTVTIQYYQSADEITWKACANGDNENKDYAFYEDGFSVTKKIRNTSYDISLYGKATKLSMPVVSGQFTADGSTNGTAADDGVKIIMKQIDAAGTYTIDCGETTTVSQTKGSTAEEKHGNFAGLGNGFNWFDTEYKGKFAESKVQISVEGKENAVTVLDIRSDINAYSVQLSNVTAE